MSSLKRSWADMIEAYYPPNYPIWNYFYGCGHYLYLTPWADGKRFKRLIEVGTGTALAPICAKLMHPRKRVVAVDSSARVVELARQRCKGLKIDIDVRQADARSLPFRDAEFDSLLSEGMLEHYAEPDRIQIIREFTRIAHRLVIDLPIAKRHLGVEEGMGDEFLSGTPSYWVDLFGREGLRILDEFIREKRGDRIIRCGWVLE